MGCASSIDADGRRGRRNITTVRCASYAAVETHPAIAAAEQPLHAAADFGSYITPDDPHYEAVEEYEHFAARNGAYATSNGEIGDEPSAFARSVAISVRVASARLGHGINGDPCQFAVEPESVYTIDGAVRKTVQWLESCEAAAAGATAPVPDAATDDAEDPPFTIPPAVVAGGGSTSCGGGGDDRELGITSPISTLRIAISGRSIDTPADSPTQRRPLGTLPVAPERVRVVVEDDSPVKGAHDTLSPSSALRGAGPPSASSTDGKRDAPFTSPS